MTVQRQKLGSFDSIVTRHLPGSYDDFSFDLTNLKFSALFSWTLNFHLDPSSETRGELEHCMTVRGARQCTNTAHKC